MNCTSQMQLTDKGLRTGAPGRYGLVHFLTWCQPRCSSKSSNDLKKIYMKCKENYCPPVEFLYLAADVIEKPGLVKAMVGNRSLAIQSELLMPGATGEQAPSKTNAPDQRALEDSSFLTKPEKNFPEADDVLTLAGVDPNDEAKLMLAQGSRDDQSFHGRRAKKNSSRKLTELCIFARVIGQLPCSGICKVDNKAYDLLEEALQIHLRCLIMKIVNRALQRNDSKPNVLGRSNTRSEPKQRIRQINIDAEVQKRERLDIERKALLRVGESILSKRRTRAGDDSHLKEKVARIRQEEEERIRATMANDAARSALGLLIHYTCMSSDNFRSPLMSLFKFHFRRCKILEVVCIVRGQRSGP
mmetsp:Transcript_12645/g.49237  ORF Transcript_12645/g.49237 Transcript_12645/m.49237 type:complete len:358 (-) Transcript_12645:2002-3075(-)